MLQRYTVGLLLDPAWSYTRETLRGIYDYAAENPHWELNLLDSASPDPAALSACDGIIGYFKDQAQAAPALRHSKPVVACEAHLRAPGLLRCLPDNVEVGRLATAHLLERGCRSMAFVGGPLRSRGMRFSNLRELGFRRALRDENQHTSIATWRQHVDGDLVSWLRTLPRPTGVFAACDNLGVDVIRAAKSIGLRIPDDLAVVSVDDDELTCEALRPTLSSVNLNLRRVGWEAAQMLQDWMVGRPSPKRRRILPLGVTERQSTATFAGNDSLVAAVMTYLRTNLAQPLTVEHLLDRFMVSRRTLELHVRRELGCTPLQAIRRTRLSHAQRLLRHSNLPVLRIAAACGFTDHRHFSTVFRKELGITPTAFRAQHHGRPFAPSARLGASPPDYEPNVWLNG